MINGKYVLLLKYFLDFPLFLFTIFDCLWALNSSLEVSVNYYLQVSSQVWTLAGPKDNQSLVSQSLLFATVCLIFVLKG